MRPVLAGERPFAIAHRGSRLIWPENTMLAFGQAYESGFRWIETDLHLSSDGVVTCIHDSTVDRTTDGKGPVSAFSSEELARLDAGYQFEIAGNHPYRDRGWGVPTLEEVLTTYHDARFVVDLKEAGLAGPVWELLQAVEAVDRVIVGSFSDRRLSEFRDLSGGRVATSAGRLSVARTLARSKARTSPRLADALQVPANFRGVPVVTPSSVDRFHAVGYQVHVWTVNTSKQMNKLLDMGVDGIITDRPDMLKAVLIERGQWTGK